ncbi:MAG: redoxin family protein [Xanthomonadales bacterium]|jgi:hypothetical protein|nr:redoxin family protein [Xanthomonadales bacterium]
MIRWTVLLLALAGAAPLAASEDIPVVTSWDHYREILVDEGKTDTEADRRIAELLSGLEGMDRAAGSDRIRVAAPSVRFDGWLNSEPLTLDDLRGQVVLVRCWTETCPFCASSAPALRMIDDHYGPRGLTVVGVYRG